MTDTDHTPVDPDEATDGDPQAAVEQPTAPAHANRAHATVAWDADASPITQEQVEGRDKSEVVVPGEALMGPKSERVGDTTAAAARLAESEGPSDAELADVPTNAHDVVVWIKEAEDNEAEATRRAGLAWAVESKRSEGVRSTVEAEVDRWLEPSSG